MVWFQYIITIGAWHLSISSLTINFLHPADTGCPLAVWESHHRPPRRNSNSIWWSTWLHEDFWHQLTCMIEWNLTCDETDEPIATEFLSEVERYTVCQPSTCSLGLQRRQASVVVWCGKRWNVKTTQHCWTHLGHRQSRRVYGLSIRSPYHLHLQTQTYIYKSLKCTECKH